MIRELSNITIVFLICCLTLLRPAFGEPNLPETPFDREEIKRTILSSIEQQLILSVSQAMADGGFDSERIRKFLKSPPFKTYRKKILFSPEIQRSVETLTNKISSTKNISNKIERIFEKLSEEQRTNYQNALIQHYQSKRQPQTAKKPKKWLTKLLAWIFE